MDVLVPTRNSEGGGLSETIGKILDKGLIINADIAVSVAGVELLGIKIRAALASFDTAAKYGLEFPSGTNLKAVGWKDVEKVKVDCPGCGNQRYEEELLNRGCQVCGWISPLKRREITVV